MKCKAIVMILLPCLLLSGCGLILNGEYIWTEKYSVPQSQTDGEYVQITNYLQLQDALESMVENGVIRRVFSVAGYTSDNRDADFASAVKELKNNHPIAAYAVDEILCEFGTIAGDPMLVIKISYLHNRSEIRDIVSVANNDEAMDRVYEALADCRDSLVLQIVDYRVMDFSKRIEAYAMENPHIVMELPWVVEDVYPKTGKTRLVALEFHYQTGQSDMRAMQETVSAVLADAGQQIAEQLSSHDRYAGLYAFMANRYDYIHATTDTPVFSLLCHGVGDSRAFAMAYAAMCRQAGLECRTVSGTRDGQSWYWNIICFEGVYYHVDLLQCCEDGSFSFSGDGEMEGYVWDRTSHLACGA